MPISYEPSTFEFTRDWLLSSDTFVRDAMGATALALDDARDEARARIHDEEAYDEADEAEANETAPDLPPSVNPRPRAIVRTNTNTQRRNGLATWRGEGELLLLVEVNVPEAYVPTSTDTTQAKAAKFSERRQWARRLAETIREELKATSGLGSVDGVPYLNASEIEYDQMPNVGEDAEADAESWMGWAWRVAWN